MARRTAHTDTELVHAGFSNDPATGAVVPPIHFTTTYRQDEPGKNKGYEYSRSGNPTRAVFEDAMAAAESGSRGLAFASGLAATDCLMRLVRPGDHVVAGDNLYGGTHRLFSRILAHYGLDFTYVDTRDPKNVADAIRPATRMVFLETPSNPNLYITDIAACVDVVRKAEKKQKRKKDRRMLVVVDNTFATPYNQRPIELGADVALHSVTKYIGGHSDVLGGALVVDDKTLGQELWYHQNAIGGVMDPFSAYMAHRGLKTLHLRMERHAANAQRVAESLAGHAKVKRVWYPGLADAPQHALCREQMRTAGGMLSFELKGGLAAGKRFMRSVALWAVAESLGAVESLINHPVTMTHGAIPKEERERSGLTDGLIRLSVGIEDANDLIQDLEQALKKA